MSIRCNGCFKFIKQPDSVWFACTKQSWSVQYLCGTCVNSIPVDLRHPVDEMQDYEITVGVLYANTNKDGYYQGIDSRKGPVRFWAPSYAFTDNLPKDQMLTDELYPYYDPVSFCRTTSELADEGAFDEEGARNDLYRMLTVYGAFLERYLNHDDTVPVVRKRLTPYQVPNPLTDPELLKLARELYARIRINEQIEKKKRGLEAYAPDDIGKTFVDERGGRRTFSGYNEDGEPMVTLQLSPGERAVLKDLIGVLKEAKDRDEQG